MSAATDVMAAGITRLVGLVVATAAALTFCAPAANAAAPPSGLTCAFDLEGGMWSAWGTAHCVHANGFVQSAAVEMPQPTVTRYSCGSRPQVVVRGTFVLHFPEGDFSEQATITADDGVGLAGQVSLGSGSWGPVVWDVLQVRYVGRCLSLDPESRSWQVHGAFAPRASN